MSIVTSWMKLELSRKNQERDEENTDGVWQGVLCSLRDTILYMYEWGMGIVQVSSYFVLSTGKQIKDSALTLPVPCISESCIEIKIKFLFSHFFVVSQKVL